MFKGSSEQGSSPEDVSTELKGQTHMWRFIEQPGKWNSNLTETKLFSEGTVCVCVSVPVLHVYVHVCLVEPVWKLKLTKSMEKSSVFSSQETQEAADLCYYGDYD